MKICIVGAGAMGTLLGVRFIESGYEVCFIDRDNQLAEIQKNGLSLISIDGETKCLENVSAYANFDEPGPQDLIIVALKAHQISQVAEKLHQLMDQTTMVMSLQNGIPWWYFQNHGGEHDDLRLSTLDPDGILQSSIDASRIIGCVAYPAAEVVQPGVTRHIEGNRFTIGELDGTLSDRCHAIADALISSGFKSYVIDNIRAEIWLKVWGSLSFNTISALTRATMVEICQFDGTRRIVESMMTEAQVVANKLGIEFRHTIEKRIAGAESVGAHKTSMLQDVESNQEMEIDAIIGAMIELAKITETEVPTIETVYSCCRLLNECVVHGQG